MQGEQIVTAMGLQKLTLSPIGPGCIASALAIMTSPSMPKSELIAQLLATLQQPAGTTQSVTTAIDTQFGSLAAVDEWVLFEQSPKALDSLANLAASAKVRALELM